MRTTKELSILYAENNEDCGLMLSTLLGLCGIRVSLARTVRDAISSAQSNDFDLFLLDSRFEDGSGVELCRQLARIRADTPSVFYSGYASGADRKKGLEAGAVAYLVKPEIDSVAPAIFRYAKGGTEAAFDTSSSGKYEYARYRTDRNLKTG